MKKKVLLVGFITLIICGLYITNDNTEQIKYVMSVTGKEDKILKTISDNILVPAASGKIVFDNEYGVIDASNADQGYIMAKYLGANKKVRIQIDTPNENTYTYVLSEKMDTFPLSEGNGRYDIRIYENIEKDDYALVLSGSITVKIKDDKLPYLYPNQYIWYEENWDVVTKSNEIASSCNDDIEIVQAVYNYVTENIKYDYSMADDVQYGYLPNVDQTIQKESGICFDIASLMCAMLRIQKIPCKLETGYVNDEYHAWLSVYVENGGIIDEYITFKGEEWNLIDPTFGASIGSEKANEYIKDKAYNTIYIY